MTTPRPRPEARARRRSRPYATLLALGLLLVAPIWALTQVTVGVDARLLASLATGCSVLTFFAYRYDKRQAEAAEWRVPEATLQGLAFIGGWPGAFLAQRIFRHKTAKLSFQATFWLIVLFYQYLAIDLALDWQLFHLARKSMGL